MIKQSLALLAAALVPACVYAVDGVILINQSTVMAAGGFPYTISQPGSYKLTGNLVVPNFVSGIQISASNVTLDLNGFTISGATRPFTGPGTSLIKTTAPVSGITLQNGTLSGSLTSNLIDISTASGSLLEHLNLHDDAGGNESFFGKNVVVRAVSNPGGTIAVQCPALVTDSLAFIFGRIQTSSTACNFGFVTGQIQ